MQKGSPKFESQTPEKSYQELYGFSKGYETAYKEVDEQLKKFIANIRNATIASDVEAIDFWIISLHDLFNHSKEHEENAINQYYDELFKQNV